MSIFTSYIVFFLIIFLEFLLIFNHDILGQNICQHIFYIFDISIKLNYRYIYNYRYFHP